MADKSAEPSEPPALSSSAGGSFNINNWLIPFCLSDKFKFATRVAVSLTLAFLLPMALGLPQASTAATTVMLIASTGSRRESIAKGTLRVLGTIAGAIIGLLLVGLFAQDRLLYMLCVSLVVAIIFYIRNAYLEDPTLFMLTGVMVLMMFNGGDAEGAFLYGVDRTYMTVFGVVIYTLVGILIFPPQVEQNLHRLAAELGKVQHQLFSRISKKVPAPESANAQSTVSDLITALYAAQEAFESRYSTISTECSEISAYKKEWDYALYYYKQITELLLFAAKSHDPLPAQSRQYIENYDQLVGDIEQLFEQVPAAWEKKEGQSQGQGTDVLFDTEKMQDCGHLQRGAAITSGYLYGQLSEKLACLVSAVGCIDSVTGRVAFDEPLPAGQPSFNWWDAENAKTAVKVFATYWFTGLIWILFNPPGGYNFVVFSTLFVSILSFLPVHPVLLFILFTLGFVFSVPAYVFILPQLTLGIELAVFIFIYTFVGFYIFKGPITIFFLIGMFTLGIDNNMIYHFGITLTIVTLFYLVVFMVVLSYYLPFTSRPEHLFLVMRERFFRHVCGVIAAHQILSPSLWNRWLLGWHLVTMKITVKKLKVWASKVNAGYYDQLTTEKLMEFAACCELLCHHLITLSKVEPRLRANKLVTGARRAHRDHVLPAVARHLFLLDVKPEKQDEPGAALLDAAQDYSELEKQLDIYFQNITWTQYLKSDIAGFYIFLNLKKNIFESLLQSKVSSDAINWAALTQNRF